ncbi:hypothetical protein ACKFC9_001664 [Campylobacter jejuni]
MNRKEKRGIYNVSFNEKPSTPINAELEAIENAVIEYVIHYVKGWHNTKRDKGRGAEHIKLHLEPNSEGQITLEELLNIGNSVREYLEIFKEPHKDSNESRVYEWENNNNVRFRLVTDKNYKQITKGEGHSSTPLSPSDEIIITFYSDRNLNQRMQFKNLKVETYYSTQQNKTQEQEQEQDKSQFFKSKFKEFTENKLQNKDTNKDKGKINER